MMKLTRRNFIKTIGASVAGNVLASRAAVVWSKSDKQPLPAIGCGKMSNVDLRQYYESFQGDPVIRLFPSE